MLFNDHRNTQYSSLFDGTTFGFKLYEIQVKISSNHTGSIIRVVEPKFLLENNLIQVSKLFEFPNLRHGNYLTELFINQKSPYCNVSNQCVEESHFNNQFKCVKCNKLIVVFNLKKNIYKIFKNETNQDLTYSVSDLIDLKNVHDEIFKCALNGIYSNDLYSFIVPFDSTIDSLRLPFHFVDRELDFNLDVSMSDYLATILSVGSVIGFFLVSICFLRSKILNSKYQICFIIGLEIEFKKPLLSLLGKKNL